MKRLVIKVTAALAVLATAMILLSSCVTYPKVPEYGAVQSRFCDYNNMDRGSVGRGSISDFFIDYVFKNEQYEKDSLQTNIYLGVPRADYDPSKIKNLSMQVMAIACDDEESLDESHADQLRTVGIFLKTEEFTEEEYQDFIAGETIELMTRSDGYQNFKRQVLFEISYEELCTNYNIERVKSHRGVYAVDEIKYTKFHEANISETILSIGQGKSILFVAFEVRKEQAVEDNSGKITVKPCGYVRANYQLTDNTVTLSSK